MRKHLGDLVDQEEFMSQIEHPYFETFAGCSITHLNKCVLLTKKYPAMNDYLEEYLQTCNDINKQDKSGYSALHVACNNLDLKCSYEIVEILIKAGINVNLRNYYGDTVLNDLLKYRVGLSGYCNENIKNIIRMLIEANTDVNLQDNGGKTAIRTIESFGSKNYKKYFLNLIDANHGKMTKKAIK